MSTFAPVREARRLWERTAPQLTLDVDALECPDGAGGALPAPPSSPVANPSGFSNAPKIGVGTEPLAVPGNSPFGKGMDTTCSSATAREGRPTPNTHNTNGSGHAHSEGAREAGATGGES